MAEPFNFLSTSTKIGLPLLFAGQAQKEPFVNQALAMIDGLMPRVVVEALSEPPSNAADGEVYLVKEPGAGDWANLDNNLAVRISGAWQFITPLEGMAVFDTSTGKLLVFRTSWTSATEPPAPIGGSVIDVEARATLSSLIAELKAVGLVGSEP